MCCLPARSALPRSLVAPPALAPPSTDPSFRSVRLVRLPVRSARKSSQGRIAGAACRLLSPSPPDRHVPNDLTSRQDDPQPTRAAACLTLMPGEPRAGERRRPAAACSMCDDPAVRWCVMPGPVAASYFLDTRPLKRRVAVAPHNEGCTCGCEWPSENQATTITGCGPKSHSPERAGIPFVHRAVGPSRSPGE